MRKVIFGFLLSTTVGVAFAVTDGTLADNGTTTAVSGDSNIVPVVESSTSAISTENLFQESATSISQLALESSALPQTFALESAAVHKSKNAAFQKFDNEYNLGYSFSQFQLSNGGQQQTIQQNQTATLEIERLFDVGVWVDGSANFTTSTNSLGNQATGTGQGAQQPASQVPNLGGINFKVGYAFNPLPDSLLVTPYVLAGRNSNLAMSTIVANNFASATTDVFNTGGFGGRIEYRINPYIELYADQAYAYNWDQSAPLNGVEPQNNYVLTSTLGAKFNVYDALQLGVSGFYNNYQYVNSVPNPYSFGSLNGGNASNGTPYSIYQPQSSIGGMVTIGLTY